jgi:hypothetical protein
MKRKEVIFTIDQKGTVTWTIKGVKGSRCAGIAEAFKSLGPVVAEEKTGEYYEKEDVLTSVHGCKKNQRT